MDNASKRSKSVAAFARACQVIPGGVNSPARAFGGVGGQPVFIARGEGPYLIDIDGNRYLDYVGSWGPLILGHAHPRVVEAVSAALANGASFGAPTELETELAELIIELMPSIEMVRMVSSGTEASMSAIRLARGFTGRDVIVKFAGCYHGHVDSLLVSAGSSATTLGVPNSPGVPRGCTADTLVLRYNDVDGLRQAFAAQGDKIAGVILEPVVGNMGLVVPSGEFLAELRLLTQRHGALLIYDEVMTGFRLALGGAQELFRQKPDLTVLGKIVGGGLPVGAYGGRKDIMGQVMPAGPVFQAGTLSGNPLAMAAGLATLRELSDHPPFARMEKLSQTLADGLSAAARQAKLPHQIARVGSMWTLFFSAEPVTDYDSAKKSDTARFARFFWGMLERGVYLPCSQFEAAFVSAAHTEEHIKETIEAARSALQEEVPMSNHAIDEKHAIARLMSFLAVEGVTGQEKAIGQQVVKALLDAGVPRRAIQFDNAHEQIPLPTQTGNLIVTLPGSLPGPRRLFMTHLDTVPLCAGAVPVRKGSRIVPEGKTALGGDNRTGCACLVTLLATLIAHKVPHPPLTALFTVREESGLWGARFVDLKLLGEPVMGFNVDGRSPRDITVAAVGAERWEAEIFGRAAHAGVHPERGISAIVVASLALAEIHETGWFGKIQKDGKEGTSNVGVFGGGEAKSAGEATNVVTDYVYLRGETRSHDAKFIHVITTAYRDALRRAVKRVKDHRGRTARLRFRARKDYYPFHLKEGIAVTRHALAAAEACGWQGQLRTSNGGLDANWLVRHGIPTITFGAGQHDIHTVEEYVDLAQFLESCRYAVTLATLP